MIYLVEKFLKIWVSNRNNKKKYYEGTFFQYKSNGHMFYTALY